MGLKKLDGSTKMKDSSIFGLFIVMAYSGCIMSNTPTGNTKSNRQGGRAFKE